ncbi:MAG: InlB B-repeat-containing protein [Lachnospiraceae bacterium]
MATSWSSAFGSGIKQGKLGIAFTFEETATQLKVTAVGYLRTRYSCSDSNNKFYYDWDGSAGTSLGSITISTSSNSSWSSSNIKKLCTKTKTFTKSTSAQTGKFSLKFTGVEYGGGSGSFAKSFDIPALAKYTVSYNANGGTGAPASQTKYYGTNITLSKTIPKRDGYNFLGWGTASNDTSVNYAAGATYSSNASITLYAIWEEQVYTVSYDGNGGTGAPAEQTKEKGESITLSAEVPAMKGYSFVGWGITSNDTTVDYNPGDIYSADKSIILYAIWKESKDLMALKRDGQWKKGKTSIGGKFGTPWIKKNGEWRKGGA